MAAAGHSMRLRSRVDHEAVIQEHHGGDPTRYVTELSNEAIDAWETVRASIEVAKARCDSYKKAARVSDKWADHLYRKETELKQGFELYAEAVNTIISFYTQQGQADEAKAYQDRLQLRRQTVTQSLAVIASTLTHIESTLAQYHAAPADMAAEGAARNGGGAANDDEFSRFDKLVKPKVLQATSTPAELVDWEGDLRAYAEMSRLCKAPIASQHRVIRSFLDGTLKARTKYRVLNTTLLFGPNEEDMTTGCAEGSFLQIIRDEFLQMHPLMGRRLKFFRASSDQQPNQGWLQYYTKLYETYQNADMEGLTMEDIFVMRVLAGTLDQKILERLQKVQDKTRENIVAEAAMYEEELKSRQDMASYRGTPQSNNISASKQQQQQQQQQRGNGDNFIKKHLEKLKVAKKCTRCAEAWAEGHNQVCRGRSGVCSFCSSKNMGDRAKGHLVAACAKKANAARVQRAEVVNDDADEENNAGHAIPAVEASQSEEEFDDQAYVPPQATYCRVIEEDDGPRPPTPSAPSDVSSSPSATSTFSGFNFDEDDWMNDFLDDGDDGERAEQAEVAPTPPSRSTKRRRRRRDAQRRAKAKANIQVGEKKTPALAYILAAPSDVPRNVPIPLFDIQFRQHERRGHWHAASVIADTGANRSIFSKRLIDSCGISINNAKPEKVFLASQGAVMESSGHVLLRVKTSADSHGNYVVINAIVSATLKEQALLSYMDLRRMGVIPDDFPTRPPQVNATFATNSLECIMEKYPEVFDADNLAPMRVPPMEINVDFNNPLYRPLRCMTARKTPLHFEEAADELLQYLIANGIIVRADPNKTYAWVSPAFFVSKASGKARLVVDFSILSKFVTRTPHPFPSPRDVLRSIKSTSKWFLTADCRNGYFQLALSEEAQEFTAFLINQGVFVMTRGPQGLSATSDHFVAATDKILQGLDLIKLVDDILIQGPTPQHCLDIFESVCQRAQEYGLTLTREKVKLAQELPFAGFIISKGGIKADPVKLAALKEFPQPQNIKDLRSFCGAICQLNVLNPDIAHSMAALRPLLSSKNSFRWTQDHQTAFEKVRELVTQDMTIQPFDKTLPLRIVVDASRLFGMGYALVNVVNIDGTDKEGKPKVIEKYRIVQCNSRALLSAETRYATNELECAALCWAVKDCRYYVYGLDNFEVCTDHRALEAVFRQPLSEVVNSRMLRFREKLLDYRFVVRWIPGSKMALADALSRKPIFSPPESEIAPDNDSAMINTVAADPLLQDMVDAAEADPEYQSLVKVIEQGVDFANLPETHFGRRFPSTYDNLSIYDNMIILNDSRILVPKAAQPTVLQRVHSAHTGVERCLRRARAEFFWPDMKRDITNIVATCELCQTYRSSQPDDEIKSYPPTHNPMDLVGTDLFSLSGFQHCLLVDAHTGLILVKKLKRETSTAVINALDTWFRIVGLPQVLLSDNGPSYSSEEFKDYCIANHIRHITSSPGHARSNGLSEANVNSAKTLLKKCNNYEEFKVKLLELNSTPRIGHSQSPAELFFKRKVRTSLPGYVQVYDPEVLDDVAPAFAVGDRVRVQDLRSLLWDKKGTVVGIRPMKRSFEVNIDGGGILVRNKKFMKPLVLPLRRDNHEGGVHAKSDDSGPQAAHAAQPKSHHPSVAHEPPRDPEAQAGQQQPLRPGTGQARGGSDQLPRPLPRRRSDRIAAKKQEVRAGEDVHVPQQGVRHGKGSVRPGNCHKH